MSRWKISPESPIKQNMLRNRRFWLNRLSSIGTPTALGLLIAGITVQPLGDRRAVAAVAAPLLQNPVNITVIKAAREKDGERLAPHCDRGSVNKQENAGNGECDGDNEIYCRRCPRPDYPEELREQGIENGPVRILLEYDSNGYVTGVELLESSGHPEVDHASLEAASNYRLETHGCSGEITITLDFSIAGADRYRRPSERPSERNLMP
ncbi:MAG: energy transducer TonB [Cyanobacteria bacterium P01_G01_bin.54]